RGVSSPSSLVGEGRGGRSSQFSGRVSPGPTPTPHPSPQRGGGNWLELTGRDDGFGIAAGQAQGFGPCRMQERVQALGGEFAIEAGNGCGTCVRIVIPLPSRYPSLTLPPPPSLTVPRKQGREGWKQGEGREGATDYAGSSP